MIDPVSGGIATEAEVRAHLQQLRIWAEAYLTLDRETGGLYTLTQAILQLERALADSRGIQDVDAAAFEFLRKNQQVDFKQGIATWDHYELIGDQWRVTTWKVDATLSDPSIRTFPNE